MGKTTVKERACDDPYKLLADHLAVTHGILEIALMLKDDECLKRKVYREIRNLDYAGPFLDCVITDLHAQKRRMDFMKALDCVGLFIFESLNKERLREELYASATELGYDIDDLIDRISSGVFLEKPDQ